MDQRLDGSEATSQVNRPIRVGEPIRARGRDLRLLIGDVIEAAPDLTDCEKRVFLRLLRLSARTGKCYASQRGLARALGKSERTIRRALARLQKLGYIERVRRGCLGASIVFLWHPSYEKWLERATRNGDLAPAHFASKSLPGDCWSGHQRPHDRPPVTANQVTGDHITRNTRKHETMASDRPSRVRVAASHQSLLRVRKRCPRCGDSGVIVGPSSATWCDCETAARIRMEKGENYPNEYFALHQQIEQCKKQREAGDGRVPDEPSSAPPSDGVINDPLGG